MRPTTTLSSIATKGGCISPIKILYLGIVAFMLYHLLRPQRPPFSIPETVSPTAIVTTSDSSKLKTNGVPCSRLGIESSFNPKQLREQYGLKDNEILRSQFQEDRELLSYFNGICGGTYIEMGALDGQMGSNTYVFNRAFGWKGLLIELSPSMYEKGITKNRPNELATVNAAVCKNPTTLHFFDAGERRNDPAVNGIWEFSEESFRKMFWKDATIEDCKEVHCSPFQDLIDKHIGRGNSNSKQHYFFDIFSLDIEGAELEALETLDFNRTSFGMVVVENNNMRTDEGKENAIRAILEQNGYRFLRREHVNEWYINSHFGTIYQMD